MSNPSPGPVIAGATFPGIAGFPPADTSDIAKALSAHMPQIEWAYNPDNVNYLKQASPVQIYDQRSWKGYFGAGSAAYNPTFGTSLSNGRNVSVHANATGHGLISNQSKTIRSMAMIGYFEVDAGSLAIDGTRTLWCCGTTPNYMSLALSGAGDNFYFTIPTDSGSAESSGSLAVAPTAGGHVLALDYDFDAKTVKLYLDNSTTPAATKVFTGTPLAVNKTLAIGCVVPGSGGWEDKIGRMLFAPNQRLGGTTALDAARARAMAALGDYYGVVVAT
ncbi:hypothetical protein ATO6_15315 [Oceanicola sp. 22II-s10i]|uniref:hypothetical protein n=1 Tax=Oceanicola sp. 22II-s10i TaxID=1317116 RepID=UPI000B521418|nr:hypothetical protein [Oceanicola sp. 22II-s10i]OWU83800.1 hypothetical protein ATO6_15315 [Oceanicola sp. 22II-s10i]